ncbi:MAG TPA: hypothetical protein VKU37_05970 [Verrucomicrobiae bacterium]|nr:hypothetical protein [Verrucomicrobiae bacterium]
MSSLVAITYIALALIFSGGALAFKLGLILIMPLACIWFSDAMGSYTGLGLMAYDYPITKQSPGILVCIMGWVVLLLPAVIVVIGYFSA